MERWKTITRMFLLVQCWWMPHLAKALYLVLRYPNILWTNGRVMGKDKSYPKLSCTLFWLQRRRGATILHPEAFSGSRIMSLLGWLWSGASHLWWTIFRFYRSMQSWTWSFNPVTGIREFLLRATLQTRLQDCALTVIRISLCFYRCMSSAIPH